MIDLGVCTCGDRQGSATLVGLLTTRPPGPRVVQQGVHVVVNLVSEALSRVRVRRVRSDPDWFDQVQWDAKVAPGLESRPRHMGAAEGQDEEA